MNIGKLIFVVLYFEVMYALMICVYNSYVPYLKKELAEKEKANQSKFNKQQFVKDNRDIFGIRDKECGDIKEIYTVSPQKMGF